MTTAQTTDDFRRVHPLTPLLRFWTLILAVLAGLILNLNLSSLQAIWTALSEDTDVVIWPLLASIGGFLLACVLIWLLSLIWWKATAASRHSRAKSIRSVSDFFCINAQPPDCPSALTERMR